MLHAGYLTDRLAFLIRLFAFVAIHLLRAAHVIVRMGGWMSPSSYFESAYGPETLQIMGDAFDHAHDCLPSRFQGSAPARRKLAFLILRNMERGERDPACLAYLAALDFLR